MLGKIMLALGQFVFKFFINEKNIRKVLEFIIKQAEKHAKSTKNDIDDKSVSELKKAFGM